MKTEVLLRSIGKIHDELIADAESEANTKRKPGWAKLGTMVACHWFSVLASPHMPSEAMRQPAPSQWMSTPAWNIRLPKAGSLRMSAA